MKILAGLLLSFIFVLSILFQVCAWRGHLEIVSESCSQQQVQFFHYVRKEAANSVLNTAEVVKTSGNLEATETLLGELPENEERRNNVIENTLIPPYDAFKRNPIITETPETDQTALNVICENDHSSPDSPPITVINSQEGNFLQLRSRFFGDGFPSSGSGKAIRQHAEAMLKKDLDMYKREKSNHPHETPFVSFLRFGISNPVFALIRAALLSSPVMGGAQNVLVGISSQESFQNIEVLRGIKHADAWAVLCFLLEADKGRLIVDRNRLINSEPRPRRNRKIKTLPGAVDSPTAPNRNKVPKATKSPKFPKFPKFLSKFRGVSLRSKFQQS